MLWVHIPMTVQMGCAATMIAARAWLAASEAAYDMQLSMLHNRL